MYSDTITEEEYSEDVTLTIPLTQPAANTIVLRIIAKTRMNNGYCYLGLDEGSKRLFRPIMNTKAGSCCWPQAIDISLEDSYQFVVTLNPAESTTFVTPLPHCREDMVVESFEKMNPPPFDARVLLHLAQLDISNVFNCIKEKKYLNENVNSRSAGILTCGSEKVDIYQTTSLYDGKKRIRCRIDLASGMYDLPITGIQNLEKPKENTKVIVVLGLGRPFDNKGMFKPPRCYILVVGLFFL